jgi:copper oxidase (laccase) domain-containing protein
MLDFDPGCDAAMRPGRGDRWHIDLHAVARRRLAMIGVERVGESDDCTYSDARRFYSYRRDGVCGRMATLIWLAD